MESAVHAAVLFADVSDSTRLYERAGDVIASEAIDHCITLLKEKTVGGGGRVIKTIGDEIMAVFATADAAAHAAIEMQSSMAPLEPVAGTKLGIRIGFNFGPVLERDGDVFGDAVNVAARLCTQAQQDQIITSGDTLANFSPIVRAACRRLYSIQIKGKTHAVELVQLQWQWDKNENSTLTTSVAETFESPHATLRLKHRTTEIILDATRHSLSLGRDASAELVINDAKASRIHCHVERRINRFVLIDRSTNGTYVMFPDNTGVVLKREELPLHGHGWITLGQSRTDTEEWVEFFCEG
jgi:adenylate cyclase